MKYDTKLTIGGYTYILPQENALKVYTEMCNALIFTDFSTPSIKPILEELLLTPLDENIVEDAKAAELVGMSLYEFRQNAKAD